MIRNILLFILFLLIYSAIRTVFRSAVKSYHGDDKRARLKGEDMVFDPACRTYVLKERATLRRVHGKSTFFCSEACARKYEEQSR